MEQTEELVWTGSPSQVLNLPVYIVCALLCWLIVPIFYAIWKWLVLQNIRYELTTERLKLRAGRAQQAARRDRALPGARLQPRAAALPEALRAVEHHAGHGRPVAAGASCCARSTTGEFVLEQLRKYVEECRVKKRVLPLDLEQP